MKTFRDMHSYSMPTIRPPSIVPLRSLKHLPILLRIDNNSNNNNNAIELKDIKILSVYTLPSRASKRQQSNWITRSVLLVIYNACTNEINTSNTHKDAFGKCVYRLEYTCVFQKFMRDKSYLTLRRLKKYICKYSVPTSKKKFSSIRLNKR